MLDGATFHRLIHQDRLGIPAEQLKPDEEGPLAEWWAAYLASPPPDLPARQYPELALSVPLGEHRLIAKFDLLAIDPAAARSLWTGRPRRKQRQTGLRPGCRHGCTAMCWPRRARI